MVECADTAALLLEGFSAALYRVRGGNFVIELLDVGHGLQSE
jgi:hypothetical protein